MKPGRILILGKIPPPVGGVTIHVSRLIEDLKRKGFSAFSFYDFTNRSLPAIFRQISLFSVIHLHTSNTYLQLIVSIFCFLTNKKLIITYHGNWGRFGYLRNLAGCVSATLTYIPIAQNPESLVKMKVRNQRAVLISSFIHPGYVTPLPDTILKKLLYYRKTFTYLFCTNASNVFFDKNGNEIYGISELITYFSNRLDEALVICDPSGKVEEYINNQVSYLPQNILFIIGAYDFSNTLIVSDGFIRNTTTDGDSVSIHEALLLEIPVFATDYVTRPGPCILYKKASDVDFVKELEKCRKSLAVSLPEHKSENVTDKLIGLYSQCLGLKYKNIHLQKKTKA